MRKCKICRTHEADWAWQPFGPSEDCRDGMAFLGSHYRGFPVIPICDFCLNTMKTKPVTFEYRGVRYRAEPNSGLIVTDGLASQEVACQ